MVIKRGHSLPEQDHIMRYVPRSRLRRDEDGNVLGILPQAFAHRDGEEFLSVNWLEHFKQDKTSNLCRCIAAQRATLDVGKNCVYAVAVVEKVKQVCASKQKAVRIVYQPTKSNAAHSALQVRHNEDLNIMSDLALEFEKEMHSNSKFI
jgi:hypothetical protein